MVRSANLTPDPVHGLGDWQVADFRRALQQGRSRDGRLLLPACPYPSFTLVSDDDASALWAWLRSQPPVALPHQPHALRWPFNLDSAVDRLKPLATPHERSILYSRPRSPFG